MIDAPIAIAPLRTLRVRLGLGLLALLGLLAFVVPFVLSSALGIDPVAQDLSASLVPPGAVYWLGTDVLGRNVLARLAAAAQLSLGLALVSALSAALPGVALGLWAAWRGGWVDRALVATSDAVLAVPALLLVLLLASIAPGHQATLYLGLALALWVEYFRVVRAASRRVLQSDAVQASRLLGFGAQYVVRRHVWPELAPIVLTLLAFGAAQSVLALAALGFIGVGLQPPAAELGLMMTEFLPHYEEAPWLIAAPVLVLMALVLALMLLTQKEEPA